MSHHFYTFFVIVLVSIFDRFLKDFGRIFDGFFKVLIKIIETLVTIWNDIFWATVLTQGESVKPITAGIRSLNGQYVNNWHLVSAASLCAAIPPVAMFFLMQKHFIAGLTLGSVKQ